MSGRPGARVTDHRQLLLRDIRRLQQLLSTAAGAANRLHDRVDAKPIALETVGLDALTPRQREVVTYLVAGHRSKEIALLMGISDRTVQTHRERAMSVLGARNYADLLRRVWQAPASHNP